MERSTEIYSDGTSDGVHGFTVVKVHKKKFPGRACVSQIDDPSYTICKVLTDSINPIVEKGWSYMKDTYHFKELLDQVEFEENDIDRRVSCN